MNLFNYIFYRISCVYLRTGLETQRHDIFASGLLTLFQGFNIIPILYFLFSIKATIYLLVSMYIPLMLINWIIFFNFKRLKKFQKKWDNEEKSKRQIKGVLIIVYIVASACFFGLALSKMY